MNKPSDPDQWFEDRVASRPKRNGAAASGVSIDDFVSYMPQHSYIFKPTREMWPAASVNGCLPRVLVGFTEKGRPIYQSASKWLDQNSRVEQMTWCPGEPMLIKDRLIAEGGWIRRPGCTVFNLYRPPTIRPKAGPVEPWRNHVVHLYPDDAEHIIRWLAHRVQHPNVKINHALVLGGAQGIGKDSILEPVKHAVGPWNFIEVSPQQAFGPFNGFLRSVILRISEARDLGEFDRFKFYDHLKAYTAAPPDVLRVNEKYLREYSLPNVTGVVITTNHKTDGIFLPADDRRHHVAWSDRIKDDFTTKYWNEIWQWYTAGGHEAVAHYLATYPLNGWSPKAPPPQTHAFFEIVASSCAPEDAEMADALEALGWPDVTTLQHVKDTADPEFRVWLGDRKNSKRISHRLETCGYVAVPSGRQKDGRWKIKGKNVILYARNSLSVRDRETAARRLVEARSSP